jgi:hypothetical protein
LFGKKKYLHGYRKNVQNACRGVWWDFTNFLSINKNNNVVLKTMID